MDIADALQKYFGHSAFRPGQKALIDTLIEGKDAVGILPTGGGKSLCYQIPAIVKEGIALVVSPLISLMKDQVGALNQMGVPAAYINSTLTPGQCREAIRRAGLGRYKIIYVAPERLMTPSFLAFARDRRFSLVAVDEAHCVSQWGQDFRPAYLDIPRFISSLPARPPVGAFTATATPRVREDIVRLLELSSPRLVAQGFDRPNLYFEVRRPKDKDEEVLRVVLSKPGKCGIVYCGTRKNADNVLNALRNAGVAAVRYHAGMSDEERRLSQEDFQFDRAQVMVATNAFGMGIDKSNVAYVVHYNMPKDLESYYQEAGRAGRDGSEAECILLYSKRDVVMAQYLLSHGRDKRDLDEKAAETLEERERERLKQMTYYCTTPQCLRAFILRYFGERADAECGKCSSCVGLKALPVLNKEARPSGARADELVFTALRFLRNELALEQRLPAYLVFNDSTLRDMVDKMPTTEAAFRTVSGVGEEKCRRYARQFTALVRLLLRALEEGGLATPGDASMLARQSYGALRPWSDTELLRLAAEKAQGMSTLAMARGHGRPEEAVLSALESLKKRKENG